MSKISQRGNILHAFFATFTTLALWLVSYRLAWPKIFTQIMLIFEKNL